MNTKRYIVHFIVILLFASVPVSADLFYSGSEYKAVYDDKVAYQLKYDAVKREYAAEKARLESKIRDLDASIMSLNDRIASLEKSNADEKKSSAARIKELESQNAILKSTGSSREKELIEENKKLDARLSEEIRKLREQLTREQKDSRDKLEAMKAGYEKKCDELLARINDQNELIADLKKLSETQKAELDRLTQQANEIEKQLESEIKNGQIRLKRMQDRIIVNLDDKICFDSGSARLKPEIKKALDKLNTILINYPENRIYIEGNTDNIPIRTAAFKNNWQLSSARALSVLEYLLENIKMNPARVSAVGNGEFNPQLSNDTPENRALNRRVDIVIIPKVSAR